MAKTDDYLLRVTNASPVELVIITYDILISDINEAIGSYAANQVHFITCVNGARDALMELIGALDMNVPISEQLRELYVYTNTLLLSALVYEKKAPLEEALLILAPLRESWTKARDMCPNDDAVFKNAPKVYSGLTYGRKGPNDYVDLNPERGIKA